MHTACEQNLQRIHIAWGIWMMNVMHKTEEMKPDRKSRIDQAQSFSWHCVTWGLSGLDKLRSICMQGLHIDKFSMSLYNSFLWCSGQGYHNQWRMTDDWNEPHWEVIMHAPLISKAWYTTKTLHPVGILDNCYEFAWFTIEVRPQITNIHDILCWEHWLTQLISITRICSAQAAVRLGSHAA